MIDTKITVEHFGKIELGENGKTITSGFVFNCNGEEITEKYVKAAICNWLLENFTLYGGLFDQSFQSKVSKTGYYDGNQAIKTIGFNE